MLGRAVLACSCTPVALRVSRSSLWCFALFLYTILAGQFSLGITLVPRSCTAVALYSSVALCSAPLPCAVVFRAMMVHVGLFRTLCSRALNLRRCILSYWMAAA